MIQYKLEITYYNNEINFIVILLDDVIMTKTFHVTKRGSSYYCDGDFCFEKFDNLAESLRTNTSCYFVYQHNCIKQQIIHYDSETEILSFIDKSDNNENIFTINLFNTDDSQRANQFADEFLKVKKFINCLKDDLDE